MAFSNLIDSHSTPEPLPTEAGTAGAESAKPGLAAGSGDAASAPGTEKRVALPKPDINNITVLTESLPNEPILPWHHFDSPWLEKEESVAAEATTTVSPPPAEDGSGEQLSLALDGVPSEVTAAESPAKGIPAEADVPPLPLEEGQR